VEKNELFSMMDKVYSKAMQYSEKCYHRKELNNYEFFSKLNDMNKSYAEPEIYDSLYQELKDEFPLE